MEIVVGDTEFQAYTDMVVTYHQYKDALGLTQASAKTHPDTLEVFATLHETVRECPELVAVYTGVLRSRGDRRVSAMQQVRTLEDEIVNSLSDLEVVSDQRYFKEKEALGDDAEIRKRAEMFVRLFRSVIPVEQLPKTHRRKRSHTSNPKATKVQPIPELGVPLNEGMVIDLAVERQRRVPESNQPAKVTSPQPVRAKTRAQEFSEAFAEQQEDPLEAARRVGADAAINFILNGDKAGRFTIQQMKHALRSLAGHALLSTDEAVQERFTQIQKIVANQVKNEGPESPPRVSNYFLSDLSEDTPDWYKDAACSDKPNIDFFPGRGADTIKAKEVCASCLSKDECLEAALMRGEKFGIWGGLSERQRRALRRVRKTGEATPSEINIMISKMRGDSAPEQEDPLDEFDEIFEEAIA